MNNQKADSKSGDHEDNDHTQPINLVAARTPAPTSTFSSSSSGLTTQPLALRPHLEAQKTGLMTLYFRTPGPRPQGQVMGPVVGSQSSSGQHFTGKQGPDFKNSNISSWTVIRMPTSDMGPTGTTTANSSGTVTPGILPSALSGSGGRHMIPTAVHPVIAAGSSGPSMASIIRGSHQVPPSGHVIHQSFSSHVPRGPAAVASISAAPKSAVATPILRTPHSSATMALGSSSMMALHNPVRAKSPTLAGRTVTPPVGGSTSLPQVVDLQKSTVGHSLSTTTTHAGLGSRSLDSTVVRTGPSHPSSITIAKPINISQPIVQHLQQMYDKNTVKSVSNLSSTTTSSSSNTTPAHQTVLPGTFTSVNEAVSAISRTTVSTGFSTSIMQLSSTSLGTPLQALRASHVNQALHALSNVTSAGTPHQTLTVISAKSLMPANHSISLGTPAARSATPNTTGSSSGSSSIISSPSRPLNTASVIGATTIPVAKVYPQSPASSRSVSEPTTQDTTRSGSFHPQPVVTSTPRINPPATTANCGPQSVMISEKQNENSGVRFASLAKPQAGDGSSYATSSTAYLYHDQYPANLTMHQYSGNSSGFTTTQLRPVSFAQHTSSNASHSSIPVTNPVQPINSVMVAVDSRHHVALHPPYGTSGKTSELVSVSTSSNNNSQSVVTTSFNTLSSQGTVTNHTSPRPSILRKRTSESLNTVARKNLSGSLNNAEPMSPRPDLSNSINFTSVLSPKPTIEKSKEVISASGPATNNINSTIALIPPSAIKKEPGLPESPLHCIDPILKDSRQLVEASPRKKPRKQLLSTNELIETHSSEGDENNFDLKVKVKEEMDEDKNKNLTYYKRPSMSLLNTYRQTWKPRHNHFVRYSDVKPREEKKPTVNELANQKGILQQVNGWKVYHLSAQMEDIIEIEETVYSRLSDLLDFVESDPPVMKNRNLFSSEENRIINKLNDLIKGNLQRSKIVQEQITESKQQAIKILDHKTNVAEMVNKYVSRRPLKKKEKT
ncbi:histone deacetylase complex subunit SAP130 isoform X3 [Parasteatoda tepidariorum]|nr:histone deacetylase complex subunit SAP130 isoform X3 [Parasteatoda tepidariorum]